MNASVLALLLRGFAAGNRTRLVLAVLVIALGVALGGAVHTLHASALAEIEGAARTLAGTADVEIRGPRNGFDDALFALLARHPDVRVASPILDLEIARADSEATLRVLGIDPFRAARLQAGFLASSASTSLGAAADYLDRRNAWLTPAALARHGLRVGDALRLRGEHGVVELRVAGALPALDGAGEAAVLDIAAAQEHFGRIGRLSRIELRLHPGVDPAALRASIAAALPPGVVAAVPASIAGRAANLTRAYRVNLNALALVALLTGLFLVFSTQALQAARRRQEFALLRALGFTRRNLATLIAVEGALLGAAGALLGTALGLAASRALLTAFGTDLGAGYFRGLAAPHTPDPAILAAIAFLGIASAVLGALLVARSVGRLDVASALHDRAQDLPAADLRGARWAVALALLGLGLIALPPVAGLPVGGYAAIAAWLSAAVLAVGPVCATLLARLQPGERPVAALALAQVRHLPGHLAAAVAGIVVGAALCVAMAVMVHSFRVSLDRWLAGVVGADLYVRAAIAGDAGRFSLEDQRRVAALPGIARVEPLRYDRLVVDPDGPPVTLIARPIDARVLAGFQASPATRPTIPDALAVWVSEAAVDLHGWKTGTRIALPIEGRAVPVVVAGVFRDYARTWGAVLMEITEYRTLTGDMLANDLAVHLAHGANPTAAAQSIRRALDTLPGLAVEDATRIHQRSLEVFDRTFAATYALEAVALAIALAGVTSSFAALAWSRRREYGVLRHLGLTRREILRLMALEGAVAGALGTAIGLAAGVAISFVLIHVVNRQSFHWGLEVHWPLAGLAALALAIVALCAAGARWSAGAAVRHEAVLAVKDDA